MAIDIRSLRCFVAVVSAGSISRAADNLHLAQPALSLQIKHIEQELGVALFDRIARGVIPTAAGVRFLNHATDILRRLEVAVEDVRESAAEPAGKVAIGLPQSIAKILTVPLVQETLRRWPKVELQIIELSTGYIPNHLLTGHIDLGVSFGEEAGVGLRFDHLVDEDLILLGAPGQLSANIGSMGKKSAQIRFSELGRFPMILPAGVHSLRVLIDGYQNKHHVKLNVIAEVNAIPQLIELVAAGVGHTILSYASVKRELETGLLSGARIVNPGISRPVFLCRSATVSLSIASSALQALIFTSVKSMVADGQWPARLRIKH